MSKIKRIWKYELPILDLFVVTMPKGAKILTVQSQEVQSSMPGCQRNAVFMWALIDSAENALETRTFRTIGTGLEFTNSNKCKHLGTIQLKGGEFIYHIFEERGK